MRVVFFVYGYCKKTEKLQPWLTIFQVSKHLLSKGCEVHIVTDDCNAGSVLHTLQIHIINSMRPSNKVNVLKLIQSIKPEKLVVLPNPLSLLTPGWLPEVEADIYAFLSYPFYSRSEMIRALPYLERQDIKTYGRYALIPRGIWRSNLEKYFKGLIGQSNKTMDRVHANVGRRLEKHTIPAGIDLDFWTPSVRSNENEKKPIRFLYVGSARAIRGFEIVLKAFRAICNNTSELRMLVRSADDINQQKIDRMVSKCMGRDISQIKVVGGWLDKASLREEIQIADVAVLPFVLVPSELPVSVMECVACGTPVITTDIDGLPEAVGQGGWIVRSASVESLMVAMKECRDSAGVLQAKKQACLEQRKRMKSWAAIAKMWMHALE